MSGTAIAIKGCVSVQVSDDLMSATVGFRKSANGKPISIDDVLEAVGEAGVPIDDAVRERAAEFVRLIEEQGSPPEPLVVAEGTPPKAPEDEKLVWDERFAEEAADWQKDAPPDYYPYESVIRLQKDSVIGSIAPPVEARDGIDVKGTVIPSDGRPANLGLDEETVGRSPDDPSRVVALVPGKVVEEDHVLRISEVLEIPGDVGLESGNIDSAVDVHILGRVQDRFAVESKRSVVVAQAIDAANVTAGRDILVGRGISGRNEGRVAAGGNIVAKFTADANLVAGGDVRIARQLMNSRIQVGGFLDAENASFVGGCAYVRDGVTVASLGSDANVPTRIVVGVRPEAIREADAIDKRIARSRELIRRIRATLKPVLSDTKNVSSEQERSATEMLAKAEEIGVRLADDEKRRDELLESVYTDVAPCVTVSGTINARVSIRIGDRETYFHNELKGPVTIQKQKIKNVTEIVAVTPSTRYAKVLKNERRSVADLLDGLRAAEGA